jgi:hypothetical protein
VQVTLAEIWEDELDLVGIGIEEQQQNVPGAREGRADTFGDRVFPVLRLLLLAVRFEPGHVFDAGRDRLAMEKFR